LAHAGIAKQLTCTVPIAAEMSVARAVATHWQPLFVHHACGVAEKTARQHALAHTCGLVAETRHAGSAAHARMLYCSLHDVMHRLSGVTPATSAPHSHVPARHLVVPSGCSDAQSDIWGIHAASVCSCAPYGTGRA
jgi:hypothetical protein